MNSRRSLWTAVLVLAGTLGFLTLRSIEAQSNPGLSRRVAQLEAKVAQLEKALNESALKDGDRVALKTKVNVFIGTTNGRGAVNTGTPGQNERTVPGSDETFTIQKQP